MRRGPGRGPGLGQRTGDAGRKTRMQDPGLGRRRAHRCLSWKDEDGRRTGGPARKDAEQKAFGTWTWTRAGDRDPSLEGRGGQCQAPGRPGAAGPRTHRPVRRAALARAVTTERPLRRARPPGARHRGHERGAPPRPPSSILGRPASRSRSLAADRSAAPAPPPKMASPAPRPPHNAARCDVTRPRAAGRGPGETKPQSLQARGQMGVGRTAVAELHRHALRPARSPRPQRRSGPSRLSSARSPEPPENCK
jgi:hypothetical protein